MDAGNSSQGYIMAKRESSKGQKLQISKDKKVYTYDLNGEGRYEVFPLQMGSGTYDVAILEHKSGSQYSREFSKSIKVSLESEEIPFLYPSQYINYDESTYCVALSNQLCEGLTEDMEKFRAIRDYVKTNIMYDYMKALQITGGSITTYIPDVDDVLDNKMGICFDYSAVMACMLRAQEIPTKLVMGYVGKTYHAWNSIYIDGKWGLYDATFAVTQSKVDAKDYTADRIY